MSALLESLLGNDRRKECARNDYAYGITHNRPVKVSGRHLSEAPNESDEPEVDEALVCLDWPMPEPIKPFSQVHEEAQESARAILRGESE